MLLSAKMRAYHRLSRTPMLRRSASSRAKDITYPADGVNHRLVFIDFAAQPMHQHIDHVGLRVEAVVEDMLEDHRFRHWPIRVAHHVFDQSEFTRLQLDFLAAAPHLA